VRRCRRQAGSYSDRSRNPASAEGSAVAVVIRMKQMGRKHRHFYRIVAIDARQPRDGRAIEELGSYDPHVKNTDERVTLKPSRIRFAEAASGVSIRTRSAWSAWLESPFSTTTSARSG